MNYDIYTLSSDNNFRFLNLICLLESNLLYDKKKVNIIPFNEDSPITEHLCTIYKDTHIVKPSLVFDEIGRKIFNSSEYRKGVDSWRLFRKLNFLTEKNHNDAYKLFLDSNSIIVNSISDINLPEQYDESIIFGARSVKNRTLTPIGFDFCNTLDKEIKNGFNAGFILTKLELDEDSFLHGYKNKNIRKLINAAPEQGFIAIYSALNDITTLTLTEIDKRYKTILSGNKTNLDKNEITLGLKNKINGRTPITIKWSGLNNLNSDRKNNTHLIEFLLKNARERIESLSHKDSKLNRYIIDSIKDFIE